MNEHKPEGWPAIAPRLFTPDVPGLTNFIKTVFGATGEVRDDQPTELWIDGSVILVSDGAGMRDPLPGYLYVYVPDIDAAFREAVAAGAEVIEGPVNMPYGDRRATVKDRWGNMWQMATRQL